MAADYPISDDAEAEIQALKEKGANARWPQAIVDELFQAFDHWLEDPRLLKPMNDDEGLLRATVLNEITWMISDPDVGDRAWEYIRHIVRGLAHSDPNNLKEAWRIAVFETFAEAPECPEFLEKLFGLASHEDTRWAVFSAYENVPWRLRPHAHKYSNGRITDEDCDDWLVSQDLWDDEILMTRSLSAEEFLKRWAEAKGEQAGDDDALQRPY